MFNDVFLEIYLYDPTPRFQELEIGSDETFMRSKIKISKTVRFDLGYCPMISEIH